MEWEDKVFFVYKILKSDLSNLEEKILDLYGSDPTPDLTEVWNFADYLCNFKLISEINKDLIFKKLEEMKFENKCTLADFPDDVY